MVKKHLENDELQGNSGLMTSKLGRISILYALFALASMAVNIVTQDIVYEMVASAYRFYISVIMGTLTGLVAKYYLDKKYIFNVHPDSFSKDGLLFLLYSATGIVTTLLFWSVEYVFHVLFETKVMRYTGAVIGLSIGYYFKYWLDSRLVFKNE